MNRALQNAINRRRLPGDDVFKFAATTACDCGCGLPARVEFTVGCVTFAISDPVQIDALIDELKVGREQLWGKRGNSG